MNTSLPPSSPVLVKAPLAEPESSTPFATPEKAPVQLTSPSIPSTAVVSPNTAAREALEWSERVEVLTREDHEAYVQGAKVRLMTNYTGFCSEEEGRGREISLRREGG